MADKLRKILFIPRPVLSIGRYMYARRYELPVAFSGIFPDFFHDLRHRLRSYPAPGIWYYTIRTKLVAAILYLYKASGMCPLNPFLIADILRIILIVPIFF